MLSSNDDVSFPCSGMSLELSRSRTMSRRRSPRRAPRRPRVRSSNGWRSRRTSRRRRRRKRNQNYLLFVFLDATASRIYFILRNHDENVSYMFLLLMKNKEQAMIPLTCGWFVDLDPIEPLLVTLLLFFFVHVVLWTFPFPNFSISQIYRGLPFFFRVHPPFFLKKISFFPVFFLFVCSCKVNLSFIYFAAPFSHLSRFSILFCCFLFIFLLKHFPYCCNFSFVTLSLTGWPIFHLSTVGPKSFQEYPRFCFDFFRYWMRQ